MTHPVDKHVGKRIRNRRWMQKMTQENLAEEVGVKFQQIQKYEAGTNRVSASRLWDISQVLGVPISYFFEGLAEDISAKPKPELDQKVVALAQTLQQMPKAQRNTLIALVRSMTRK